MQRAKNDLLEILDFAASRFPGDPTPYIHRIRRRLMRHYEVGNPGIAGREPGTREWLLTPLKFIAVVAWQGDDVKVFRILPMATMKQPRRAHGTRGIYQAL
jgi:hypothetical protein